MTTEDKTTRATEIAVAETLDCSGLLCPLPVYQAGIVLNRLEDGQVLELVTTDPGALEDIPAMARQRGDSVLDISKTEENQRFLVKKGGGR
jgi:tRNA 2-thiouridine synthesizing protein A